MSWRPLMYALVAIPAAVLAGAPHAAVGAQPAAKAEARAKEDPAAFEARQLERLLTARTRMQRGDVEASLADFDAVLSEYRARYPEDGVRRLVVRSPEEALAVMVMAANDGVPAEALHVLWSDAHFMKAYALVELERFDEAIVELGHALRLAPMNSQYHAELGHISQERKEWAPSLEHYSAAEEHATFSPAASRDKDRARALRGQGFVLIEMGRLDEAERKLRASMKVDTHDTIAANELLYIEKLRAQRR